MGRLYLGQGRYGEAIGVLDAALSLDPSSLEARVNIGLAHQRAGRVEEAIEHYEYALQIGGLSAEGYNNLGLAYQDLRRLDDAERAFSDAIARTPDDLSVQINMRTLALRRRGLVGLDLYEVLVGEFPQSSALWRMAAAEYARLGQLGQAIVACEKILQLEPNDARAQRNLDLLRKRFEPGAD
jgi:tetratricopeptide (TPR) repeat protein